uniref:deoxyhypusine synthase n=1 Tax=Pseudo-nitzschia australis TaxID=44445 RepID=A0A7S4AB23_9STRA|mmetsp:Transcript_18627/g.40554  ORF Transcript_18627/g.40554 Transcript_18627/m.40554 type:complete len:447 (+) Transcript_18627:181-1521(+)|eukprot:CAMPEP_0168234054 /NCGR_PEP_ID=MMETSP0140_2-20121125/18051_1 /TAXON_ID=44445 /ORGANISM="Pseudo-nitzschia australis, Strain 10249 10 AB" /LENGTH=446 /DNA_ID=CAMNT_0008166801 /DNA_START=134 /DNA_END=1474 /DNA_ORIENTATION=-
MTTTEKTILSETAAAATGAAMNTNPLEAKPLDKANPVTANPHIPSISASAVLGESSSMPEDTPVCKGVEFGNGNNASNGNEDMLSQIMKAFRHTGFQATNIGLAVEQIQEMRKWRLNHVPFKEGVDDPELRSEETRKRLRARIFLSYTSNQISCGQREVLRFLVQHKMVDCIVTTAGGIEEDLMKCFEPTFMGDFKLDGRSLRKKGINRIGNLLVPNKNYCKFEDWVSPIIEKMHDEQDEKLIEWARVVTKLESTENNDEQLPQQFAWTPSRFIHRLGVEINNDESLLYWAAKNEIPVFCPALTDGSVGDMLYFHSYKRAGFILDINEDIRRINDLAVRSHATGMIILGGGLVKHHTCNANLMRNGADWSVYINTGQEFDGSDSGASPDEAISWGKIRMTAKPVKVSCDATIAFPLIVSQTFAKNVEQWKEDMKDTACFIEDLKEK